MERRPLKWRWGLRRLGVTRVGKIMDGKIIFWKACARNFEKNSRSGSVEVSTVVESRFGFRYGAKQREDFLDRMDRMNKR